MKPWKKEVLGFTKELWRIRKELDEIRDPKEDPRYLDIAVAITELAFEMDGFVQCSNGKGER